MPSVAGAGATGATELAGFTDAVSLVLTNGDIFTREK